MRKENDWEAPSAGNGNLRNGTPGTAQKAATTASPQNGTHAAQDHETGEDARLLTTPPSAEEVEHGGFGVFLKQQATSTAGDEEVPAGEPEEEDEAAAQKAEEKPSYAAPAPAAEHRPPTGLLKRPQSNSPPPTPAPEPMSATTLQRMKEQGIYRNAYFKDADCFECRHKFKVGRSSRSASCPQCGTLISLEDVEINMDSTQPIKTRGDLLIRKRGHLSTDLVFCRDLRCQGTFEANVQASGDALFRTTGSIIGEVRCRRFVVEKGADVVFLNPIHAEEAEIQARVTGTIVCTGPLNIASGGAVNGDVTARSVAIEPGGELNGAMNIVRGQAARPAEPPAA